MMAETNKTIKARLTVKSLEIERRFVNRDDDKVFCDLSFREQDTIFSCSFIWVKCQVLQIFRKQISQG